MTTHRILTAAALLLCLLATPFTKVTAQAAKGKQPTYVLVHGAWGGSWSFKKVDSMLTARGYNVYRPSLTGQGERVHLASQDINLTTHINDVVNAILFEDLHDVILMGHSYGGMVVTGAADRIPDRIKRLVYLDAFVPNDGESAFSAQGSPAQSEGIRRMEKDGFLVPAWVKADQKPPKDVPHPVKTLTEPISLKNAAARQLPVTYILTVDPGKKPEEDGFFRFAQRAKERGWNYIEMSADHNPQWSKPQELVELLDKAK
ncbi:alpha/beta fold hydrolase [Telluribacter sp. SYSU D00476]|uniref:alpha/beta fold hydrolase n=1 Tax=Telluribacter sp. SYSU D00476 TaxID=2811430 RepID=UPI001FF1E388|nr:alpha/beta hydrolase [Telluribacter sp. SYSU D00476]